MAAGVASPISIFAAVVLLATSSGCGTQIPTPTPSLTPAQTLAPTPTTGPRPTPAPAAAPLTPLPTQPQTPHPTAETSGPPKSSEHRIGVRTVDGIGEFYDRRTGDRFIPRGNNLVRLDATYHDIFNPGSYDAADLEAQLAAMSALGYNVVRVFLDHRVGGLVAPGSSGLSAAYMDNIADFLRRAETHGLYVMFTQDWLPDDVRYAIGPAPSVGGINVTYLTQAGIDANTLFFGDFVSALIARDAPLDAVWSYELRNELYVDANSPPFSLTGGEVTIPNGMTYDMANADQKRALLADGTVYWTDRVRAAILELDPTALVSVGFFVPQEPNPVRVGDTRLVETSEELAQSAADFIDLHAYPGLDLTLPQHVQNFGLEQPHAKPVVMGEMGAFTNVFTTVEAAAQTLVSRQADSCDFGFDGWLLWTWDGGGTSTGVWNATDANGKLADALSPANRPDPCSHEGGVPANLALHQPTKASNELSDSPPSAAVDGLFDTIWNAGDSAPQWIEVDLAQPISSGTVTMVVAQSPSGPTVHRIYGRRQRDGRLTLLHTFEGQTSDGQTLTFDFEVDEQLVSLRVETQSSPSWVAWREIEVTVPD